MSKRISLILPDEVYRQAQTLAGRSGRNVAEVLTEAIESSFDPLGLSAAEVHPASEWSDSELLAAAQSMMSPQDDQRLSELLNLQREGMLNVNDREALRNLMNDYQTGLLRKSAGLSEAVRRGLVSAPLP